MFLKCLRNLLSAIISKIPSESSPDIAYSSNTLGASGSTYTAPCNGYISVRLGGVNTNAAYSRIMRNGQLLGLAHQHSVSFNGYYDHISLSVKKGDSVRVEYAGFTGESKNYSFIRKGGGEVIAYLVTRRKGGLAYV